MLECLILGDSIAVGTAQFKPECVAYAKSGINSKQWLDKNIDKSPYVAKTIIISLGSNDHKYVKTESELEQIRALSQADRVFWILPAINPDIQDIVRRVAEKHADTVLPIPRLQPDGVHPSRSGYKDIANSVRDR